MLQIGALSEDVLVLGAGTLTTVWFTSQCLQFSVTRTDSKRGHTRVFVCLHAVKWEDRPVNVQALKHHLSDVRWSSLFNQTTIASSG